MKSMLKRCMELLGIMVIAWPACSLSSLAEGPPPAPDRYTAQDRRTAESLNAIGDKAYRAGQFDTARKAYMESYPNFPNPYAYLMSGDAYWRAVLAAHQDGQGQEAGRCRVTNAHFFSDVRRSLEEHFQRGLALRPAKGGAGEPSAELRQRASVTAACLGELAKHYESQPASTCIALDRLSGCLGTPLLK